MSPLLHALLVLSAAASDGTATRVAPASPTRAIEILIVGPESGRSKMRDAIQPLLRDEPDLSWSDSDGLPVDEAVPAAASAGGARICIDLANPVQLRVYLPATSAGATTVRTVERPEGEDADLVVRETVAQIVKAAIEGLRGEDAMLSSGPGPESPGPGPTEAVAAHAAAPPGRPAPAVQVPQVRRFGFVMAAGAHTSPFNLAEPAGSKNWLGPTVVGQIRWHLDRYLLALHMAWETSDRSVDEYYLKNTYWSGTVTAASFFDSGIASFGIGLGAGLLLLQQKTWLDGEWLATNGSSPAATLPGQTGKTASAGGLFGPEVEFSLAPTPRLFLHLGASIPIAVLRTKDEHGTRWGMGPYFRLTMGVGFRL